MKDHSLLKVKNYENIDYGIKKTQNFSSSQEKSPEAFLFRQQLRTENIYESLTQFSFLKFNLGNHEIMFLSN